MTENDGQKQPLIKVENLVQSFVVAKNQMTYVIGEASFEIHRGTFNIIYGQSGSGKSTMLNVLSGLQKPTEGRILYANQDVYQLTSDELAYFRANKIGIVYQQNYWVKSLNVLENVAIPMYMQGYTKYEASKAAKRALGVVKMDYYADKDPSTLSGGEQQRIGMARAIINDPEVIIADEPTGNLDSTTGDAIIDFLVNMQTFFGRTIILVTHNMEYLTLADHLLNIQDGVVTDTKDEDIESITSGLMKDVRSRVDHFANVRKKDLS